MTSPAAADLVRSRKLGEVVTRFAPANRVTVRVQTRLHYRQVFRFSLSASAFVALPVVYRPTP